MKVANFKEFFITKEDYMSGNTVVSFLFGGEQTEKSKGAILKTG